ncbi:MAG TPA: HAD hydrolase family protein [Chthonomonadales bacterium]|nr:HAD hydrolase family protein [Chthonomonadales bacterium]
MPLSSIPSWAKRRKARHPRETAPVAERKLAEIAHRLKQVRLLAMDVDGVLTDGRLSIDSNGVEQKSFHVADGLGLVALKRCGIDIVWISGRVSGAVRKRAAELGIGNLLENIGDKGSALTSVLTALAVQQEQAAYIGDDWNDLPAFHAVGIRIAVSNGSAEILDAADAVTMKPGGYGAVREVCDEILAAQDSRAAALDLYLRALVE